MSCLSFIITTEVQVRMQMGVCIKQRSIDVAGDRIIEIVLLFLYIILQYFRLMFR